MEIKEKQKYASKREAMSFQKKAYNFAKDLDFSGMT